MTPYEWLTRFTACALCTRPLAEGDRIVVFDVFPGAQVSACLACFDRQEPPRLERLTDAARARLRALSETPPAKGLRP